MPSVPPPPRPSASLAALLLGVLMSACGGGGGGAAAPTPAPSPAPTPAPAPAPAPAPGPAPMLGSCSAFPATALFNQRIDDSARFPAHANSDAWIASIGAGVAFHADWGSNENPAAADYYGLPVNLLAANVPQTDWPAFDYTADGAPDESDCAVPTSGGSGFQLKRDCSTVAAASRRFPFPRDNLIKLEGGSCNDPNSCGDRHVLTVEQGQCRLWESYFTYQSGGRWSAYSTAAWDLNSNALRPSGWTSGDAAGLPITPLLARADEAAAGEIRHALRVTFRDAVIANQFVWPARHRAGNSSGGVPFGALLRLKRSYVIPASWTPQAKALATAMQRYGLYVADIGSNLYVQGEPSAQWQAQTVPQIQTLRAGDFEFVDLGVVTRDPRFSADSLQASW